MNNKELEFNLLELPLIRAKTKSAGVEKFSLPGVLSALTFNEIEAFPALRPHQRFVWHAFLVQLAALALRNSGTDSAPNGPDGWAAMLRGLTTEYEDDAPWHLVSHPLKPAILQAPVPDGDLVGFNIVETPSELDTVLTGTPRNHDLKQHAISPVHVDDWLFSLVSVQTQSAYMLKYPGVSRMGENFGTRTCFTLRPRSGLGAWFCRDLQIAVQLERQTSNKIYGRGLTWLAPWDGEEALGIDDLPVLFIEICQRIRFVANDFGPLARRKADAKPRIGSKTQRNATRGVLSDPWLPVQIAHKQKEADFPKAVSVRESGIKYHTILRWLDGKYFNKPPTLCLLPDDRLREMEIFACAVARRGDRSVTLGYWERSIPAPNMPANAFGPKTIDMIGEVGRSRAGDIAILVARVLMPALICLMRQGRLDKEPSRKRDEELRGRANIWIARLENEVDGEFFQELWMELEAPTEDRDAIRETWLKRWIGRARSLLEEAGRSMPLAAIHRYRARAEALREFDDRKRGNDAFAHVFRLESGHE